jgi:hypothetical protein
MNCIRRNEVKEGEMCGACGTHERDVSERFWWRNLKEIVWRPRRIWEDYIKMYLREGEC